MGGPGMRWLAEASVGGPLVIVGLAGERERPGDLERSSKRIAEKSSSTEILVTDSFSVAEDREHHGLDQFNEVRVPGIPRFGILKIDKKVRRMAALPGFAG